MRKRFLVHAAVGALVLAAAFGYSRAARAEDWWNGGGFALDHRFHSVYDNMFPAVPVPSFVAQGVGRLKPLAPNQRVNVIDGQSGTTIPQSPYIEATPEERDRAIRDERTCAPIKLYTDGGLILQRAQGCRK